MHASSSHLAVVPAYNESDTIVRVIDSLREHAPEFDVLVVDDGSTDGTGELARDAGARVVRHPFNLGIGGAVQSGFAFARDHGYAQMVQVDGDGQHDPREIGRLVREMEKRPELDVVCGSRFLEDLQYRGPVS